MARIFELIDVNVSGRQASLSAALAPYARLIAFGYRVKVRLAVSGQLYDLSTLTSFYKPKREQRVGVEPVGDVNTSRQWRQEFDRLFNVEYEAGAEAVCDKYVPEGTVIYLPTPSSERESYRQLDRTSAYFLNADWLANMWRFPADVKDWFHEYRWGFRADYTGVSYGEPPRSRREVTTVRLVMPDGQEEIVELRDTSPW